MWHTKHISAPYLFFQWRAVKFLFVLCFFQEVNKFPTPFWIFLSRLYKWTQTQGISVLLLLFVRRQQVKIRLTFDARERERISYFSKVTPILTRLSDLGDQNFLTVRIIGRMPSLTLLKHTLSGRLTSQTIESLWPLIWLKIPRLNVQTFE